MRTQSFSRMFAAVALLMAWAPVFGQQAEVIALPELKAPAPVSRPIVCDGRLDDAEWEGALSVGPFYTQFNRGAARAQTTAKIHWDQANLYVGFDCKDPEPGKIVAPERARDGSIFGDDVVEIMVNTRPEVKQFIVHHLSVSAANVQFDSRITPSGVDVGFDARWQSNVTKNKDGWQAEMVIPLVEIGVAQAGYWDVNLYRECPRLQEYTCWSPTYGPFHTLSRFGKIVGIRSNIYGVQTIDAVTPGPMVWGQRTGEVAVNNRAKKARELVVGLDVQAPDFSRARYRVTAKVPAGATTRVEVPFRSDLAGAYQAQAVVEDKETGRVLAVSPMRFAFAPLTVKPVSRSVVIGRAWPVEIVPALSEADMKASVILMRFVREGQGDVVQEFAAKPVFASLETTKLLPGVYELVGQIVRDGKVVFATSTRVQVDRGIKE
jgi:hypothetical protein